MEEMDKKIALVRTRRQRYDASKIPSVEITYSTHTQKIRYMPPNTYLPISSVASKAANDLVDLLIVQGQVGTLLGVSVGIEVMILTNAQMRDIAAVFVDYFSLGIIQAELAVLDAELPTTAHGLVVVLDTKGLAFGHTNLRRLATASTDGVVDAGEAGISDWGYPISVGSASVLVGGAGAKAGGGRSFEIGILGGRSRSRSEDARRRQHGGQHEREFHSWSAASLNLIYLSKVWSSLRNERSNAFYIATSSSTSFSNRCVEKESWDI